MSNKTRAKNQSLSILNRLFASYTGPAFNVRFWDGSVGDMSQEQSPHFTLVLHHPGALRQMFFPPTERSLGEAFIYKDFDLEGDLYKAFHLADYIQNQTWSFKDILWYGWKLLTLPRKDRMKAGDETNQVSGQIHSPERDRQAISYHYDVSNDFYALWLDKNMIYSCAYFSEKDLDIHTAQERKMGYICKKLRLEQGEYLLDIGCGWGGQIMCEAKKYGVKALGITLSRNQLEYARQQIKDRGLEDLCEVKLLDYREISSDLRFDKIVSVGMVEHVGEEKLSTYFNQAFQLLKPEGLFLNHGIASMYTDPHRDRASKNSFGDNYVFPDGELTLINNMLHYAESAGFEVRDVESLREHYAQTLRHWVQRLQNKRQKALQLVDEKTYRIWELFMSASAHGFEIGRLNLYQTLLAKPTPGGSVGHPPTRADLYP